MRALKIVAEGLTTSFRYPHFMQGVQPTYDMPPPATLYGHVASALGEWFDPAAARFAVHFTYQQRITDVETTHLLGASSGYLPDTRHPKTLEGASNPFQREILFAPRLTLYLDRPEWEAAFRSPRYAVVLGRSQDLFTYRQVQVVDLQPCEQAYLEHTLLPYHLARRTGRGQVALMPRWIDPGFAEDCDGRAHSRQTRRPFFSRYLVLHAGVHTGSLLQMPGDPSLEVWADPTEPPLAGDPRGLVFLSWNSMEADFDADPTHLA